MQTSDERLFKLASALLEVQMLKVITELKSVAPSQIIGKELVAQTHVRFEDLTKAMEEFGVLLRRPLYLEER